MRPSGPEFVAQVTLHSCGLKARACVEVVEYARSAWAVRSESTAPAIALSSANRRAHERTTNTEFSAWILTNREHGAGACDAT
jgi:hypothetical protein